MKMPDRVPLTIGQKARLIVDCYPFVLFGLVSVASVMVFRGSGHTVPAVTGDVVLFFSGYVAALFLSGYKAALRVRDLLSGVALVREDILENVVAFRLPWGRRSDHEGEGGQIGMLYLTSGAAFKRGAEDAIASCTALPASLCGLWSPWTDTREGVRKSSRAVER